MKKILTTLVALIALMYAIPTWASCANGNVGVFKRGSATGGACSIKELNLENDKAKQGKENSMPLAERNLRPLQINSRMQSQSLFGDDCLFGMCLYSNLLKGGDALGK